MEFYLLQECDLCGNDYPIHRAFHDYEPETWIEFNGKQFLCNRCREEKKHFSPLIAERQPEVL